MKHKVEIFSADCPLCRETVKMVKNSDCCKESEVVVHKCEGDECCPPAKHYRIRSVPSIVVDGVLAIEGKPSLEDLQKVVGRVCSE